MSFLFKEEKEEKKSSALFLKSLKFFKNFLGNLNHEAGPGVHKAEVGQPSPESPTGCRWVPVGAY